MDGNLTLWSEDFDLALNQIVEGWDKFKLNYIKFKETFPNFIIQRQNYYTLKIREIYHYIEDYLIRYQDIIELIKSRNPEEKSKASEKLKNLGHMINKQFKLNQNER